MPDGVLNASADDSRCDQGVITWECRCNQCGYNVQGLALAGECPECGADVEVWHEGQPETRSRTCVRCGYQLKGLKHSGRCPECGLLVAVSVDRDLQVTCTRRTVAKMADGALMAGVGLLVVMIAIPVWFVRLIQTSTVGPSWLGIPVGLTLLMAGWIVLVTAEPTLARASRSKRAWWVVAMLSGVFVLGLWLEVAVILWNGTAFSQLVGMFTLVLLAVGFLHTVVSMSYVEWLGGRIANSGLPSHARLVMWLIPLLLPVTLPCFLGLQIFLPVSPLAASLVYFTVIARLWWRLRKVLTGMTLGSRKAA